MRNPNLKVMGVCGKRGGQGPPNRDVRLPALRGPGHDFESKVIVHVLQALAIIRA